MNKIIQLEDELMQRDMEYDALERENIHLKEMVAAAQQYTEMMNAGLQAKQNYETPEQEQARTWHEQGVRAAPMEFQAKLAALGHLPPGQESRVSPAETARRAFAAQTAYAAANGRTPPGLFSRGGGAQFPRGGYRQPLPDDHEPWAQ